MQIMRMTYDDIDKNGYAKLHVYGIGTFSVFSGQNPYTNDPNCAFMPKEGANKRGNSSRLTQSFHFFMFEPIFSPVNALNQPI